MQGLMMESTRRERAVGHPKSIDQRMQIWDTLQRIKVMESHSYMLNGNNESIYYYYYSRALLNPKKSYPWHLTPNKF